MTLKAPFPYFGGKSKVSDLVWQYLGADVTNYVEPFAGSLAVLLGRPGGPGKVETVNDFDGLLANAWRAMAFDPEGVARAADWPENECDLHARHARLVTQRGAITAKLMGDPEWFDPVAAGWWIWGACAWIGSGWCSGKGPWTVEGGELVRAEGNAGQGINRQMPHVGDAGRGINRKMPHVGNAGRGEFIAEWFRALSDRLRNVRVLCGDFERTLGPSLTTRHGATGVFLDPPYSSAGAGVAARALAWCIANSFDDKLRIVLAGYEGEHDTLALLGWRAVEWKTRGGYGSRGDGTGRANAGRERLWLSPACL